MHKCLISFVVCLVPPQSRSYLRLYSEEDVVWLFQDDICGLVSLLPHLHNHRFPWIPYVWLQRKSRHFTLLRHDTWCVGRCYWNCAQDVHHLSHTSLRWQVAAFFSMGGKSNASVVQGEMDVAAPSSLRMFDDCVRCCGRWICRL